jgi:integrase
LKQAATIKKEGLASRNGLERAIAKCQSSGLDLVVDFLQTKARRSPRTALAFYRGLEHLSTYIVQQYPGYDIQNIISAVKENKVDLYKLLNSFVTFLQKETLNGPELMPRTIILYMTAAKSYFAYCDIDISTNKYRYRVSLPPLYREDEQAIDAQDIRKILQHCDNRRLKAYLFVLASGGMRAMEALGIRECDIDFRAIDFGNPSNTQEPAVVKIRKEYSKTRRDRSIFISNEAARVLNEWLVWKYRRSRNPAQARYEGREDLVFSRYHARSYPRGVYDRIAIEFRRVVASAGFVSRKEDGVFHRRNVTFHSFRRFVKTTIANQARNSDYSEWFLGHAKSPYYTNKPDEIRRIYKEDCMKYLTFFDYPMMESIGKNYEAKLKEKDIDIYALRQQIRQVNETKDLELQQLRQKETVNMDAISLLSDQMQHLMKRLKELENKQR